MSVRLRTGAGTASNGDFSGVDTVVTFAAGSTSATVSIGVKDNRKKDGSRTFTVTLYNPVGVNLGRSTATVTILDDESALLAPTVGALGMGTVTTKPTLGSTSAKTAVPPTDGQVADALAEASAFWARQGPQYGNALARVMAAGSLQVEVGSLVDTMVGYTDGTTITLDTTAAGHGWDARVGGYDLVDVLIHELGHVLGLDHAQIARVLGREV